MVVGIDPETGRLGPPTPEQIAELSAREGLMISRSGDGLVEVRHSDGSVSLNLQDRFQEFATVQVGPGGKLIYGCVDDEKALRQTFRSPPNSALEEK